MGHPFEHEQMGNAPQNQPECAGHRCHEDAYGYQRAGYSPPQGAETFPAVGPNYMPPGYSDRGFYATGPNYQGDPGIYAQGPQFQGDPGIYAQGPQFQGDPGIYVQANNVYTGGDPSMSQGPAGPMSVDQLMQVSAETGNDMATNKLANDPLFQRVMTDAQNVMSPEAYLSLAFLAQREVDGGAGTDDRSLFAKIIQDGAQMGFNPQDLQAFQNVVQTDLNGGAPQSSSQGDLYGYNGPQQPMDGSQQQQQPTMFVPDYIAQQQTWGNGDGTQTQGDATTAQPARPATPASANDAVVTQVTNDVKSNLSPEGQQIFNAALQQALQSGQMTDEQLLQNVLIIAQQNGMTTDDLQALSAINQKDIAAAQNPQSQTTASTDGSQTTDTTGQTTDTTGQTTDTTGQTTQANAQPQTDASTSGSGDPVLDKIVADAKANLSQQGLQQFATALTQIAQANPNIDDATLMSQAIPALQKAGMSAQDLQVVQAIQQQDVPASTTSSTTAMPTDTTAQTTTTAMPDTSTTSTAGLTPGTSGLTTDTSGLTNQTQATG